MPEQKLSTAKLATIGCASLIWLTLCSGFVVGAGQSLSCDSKPEPAQASEPTETALPVVSATATAPPQKNTSVCVIQIPDDPTQDVPAFPTEEGLDEFLRAVVSNASGHDRLLILGANRGKFINANTRCSFIDRGIVTTKARVLEGSFAGQAFYFPTEWTYK